MGMDVYGRHPASAAGKYFRASVWSWRPIHSLICELCTDLFDNETLTSLGFNDGAGPESDEICQKMAERFNNWLETHASGLEIDIGDVRVDQNGHFLTAEEAAKDGQVTRSPYSTDDDHLKEWVTFLQNCGGFQVY